MMEIKIKLFDVKEELPEKSGEYLCFGGGNYWANLRYSVKHKAFNVYDANEDTEYAIRFVGDWVCRETAKRRYGHDEIEELSDALIKLKAFFGERPKATTAATAESDKATK